MLIRLRNILVAHRIDKLGVFRSYLKLLCNGEKKMIIFAVTRCAEKYNMKWKSYLQGTCQSGIQWRCALPSPPPPPPSLSLSVFLHILTVLVKFERTLRQSNSLTVLWRTPRANRTHMTHILEGNSGCGYIAYSHTQPRSFHILCTTGIGIVIIIMKVNILPRNWQRKELTAKWRTTAFLPPLPSISVKL